MCDRLFLLMDCGSFNFKHTFGVGYFEEQGFRVRFC